MMNGTTMEAVGIRALHGSSERRIASGSRASHRRASTRLKVF